MKIRVPDYYDAFVCLAGQCPDTCCGPWDIVLDEATADAYRSLEGPLGDRIRASMVTIDGDPCIAVRNGRCALLSEDGLCPIISQLGEEALSITCRCHPRFTEIYGGLQETALALSCPAAAKLLLERQEPLCFVTSTDDTPPEPNDLDGDLFFALLQSRDTAISLVQDRALSMSDRLALLLEFAQRLDRAVEQQRWNVLHGLSALYSAPGYREDRLLRLRRLRSGGTMTRVRQLLLTMDPMTEEFPALLQELEITSPDWHSVEAEQLTVYFLFRWWLKAACDGYLWRQAAAAVVSVLTICSFARQTGDLQSSARLYSKEMEHAQPNLTALRRAMDLPYFDRNELLKLLEVPHAV